jgi:hypothetical protein
MTGNRQDNCPDGGPWSCARVEPRATHFDDLVARVSNRSGLREKQLMLAHSSRGFSPSWQGRHAEFTAWEHAAESLLTISRAREQREGEHRLPPVFLLSSFTPIVPSWWDGAIYTQGRPTPFSNPLEMLSQTHTQEACLCPPRGF